jgi:hypothetical protein
LAERGSAGAATALRRYLTTSRRQFYWFMDCSCAGPRWACAVPSPLLLASVHGKNPNALLVFFEATLYSRRRPSGDQPQAQGSFGSSTPSLDGSSSSTQARRRSTQPSGAPRRTRPDLVGRIGSPLEGAPARHHLEGSQWPPAPLFQLTTSRMRLLYH